ncbi:MAG: DNA starvation/stationary phase protection protein Dps [Anaerolineae bacterium]
MERTVPQFKTSNNLSAQTREDMVNTLNLHLASLTDLYSQTKQAHWNVKGIHFYQLHELFDELAAQVLEFVDMVAERATALGGMAMGTARMAAGNSELSEYPVETVEGKDVVAVLVARYATYAGLSRTAIDVAAEAGDQATADLFTEITRAMDKNLWFLEAHLQG